MRATARHVGRPRIEAQEAVAGGAEDVPSSTSWCLREGVRPWARRHAAAKTRTASSVRPQRAPGTRQAEHRHDANLARGAREPGWGRPGTKVPPSRAHLGVFGDVFSPSSRVRRSWPASRHVSPYLPSVRRTASQRPADSGAPVLVGAIQRPAAYGALGTIPDARRRIPQNIHGSHAAEHGSEHDFGSLPCSAA